MNLIKINCSELNNTIRKKIESFIYDCLKSILNTNILAKSKSLGEGCEKILNDLKSSVNTVKALYDLENKAETNRTETIPQLLNDYEDFLDWVFFYLSYDTYKVLEQAKDNVNSFEQSIKQCHDSFIQIEMSMKSLTEVLENQKKKFTADLDEERAKLMEDITKLKAEVDEDREEIKNKIYGDDSTKFLDEIEKKNEWALTCQARLKEVVEKEGYLGNAFTTEDERVEQCLNDLAPMIKYFTFINKYKVVYKKDREDLLWQINFENLDEFYNQYDLFDISMHKIPTFKERINKAKLEFESFKLTVELAKIIFPLVEIFQEEGVDEKEIYSDNKIYCAEMAKYFPPKFIKEDDEDAQAAFENLKFFDIQKYSKSLEKNRAEMEKLVEEWKIIHNMHDIEPQIVSEIDIEFVPDKYNKKEYPIINHDSFENILKALDTNINLVDKKLTELEEPKDEIIVVKTFKEIKEMMNDMYKIIKELKEVQFNLEKLMDQGAEIKKKPESFVLLKQAEKQFRGLMDILNAKKMKIKSVYFEKDKFNNNLKELEKLFADIKRNMTDL
jgi:hypothetical protein